MNEPNGTLHDTSIRGLKITKQQK